MATQENGLRFGVFEVDLGTQELRKSGRLIPLQRKPFLILAALLKQPGHLVTREELEELLWPDVIVDTKAGLNNAVKKLRRTIGDSADSPRFIETLPGRGYRFLAEVSPVIPNRETGTKPAPQMVPVPVTSGARKGIYIVLVGAALIIGVAVVAGSLKPNDQVDPDTLFINHFEVQGEDAAYAGQAFAEAVAIALSRVESLTILPVGKSGSALQADKLIRKARKEGAGRLLVGSLIRDGDSTRVTVSIWDTMRNRVIGGIQTVGAARDLHGLAFKVAQRIADTAGAQFTPAYGLSEEYYGNPNMVLSNHWTSALAALRSMDTIQAQQQTELLVEQFPAEPEAWVLRAQAMFISIAKSEETMEQVLNALHVVDALDPNHPVAAQIRLDLYQVWGALRPKRFSHELTVNPVPEFTRLLERDDLTPSLRAHLLKSRYMRQRNDGIENQRAAMGDLESVARLTPTDPWVYLAMAEMLDRKNELEQALARAKQAVVLAPSDPSAQRGVGYALGRLGRYDEAFQHLTIACDRKKSLENCLLLARSAALSGNRAVADSLLQEARGFPESPNNAYSFACYFAVTGDSGRAIEYLRKALKLGWTSSWASRDPDLVALHGTPEFEAIVAQIAVEE